MAEILRDRYGSKLGEIRDNGNEQVIYDKYGSKLGTYRNGCTYDKYGSKIGTGNLLTTLLLRFQ